LCHAIRAVQTTCQQCKAVIAYKFPLRQQTTKDRGTRSRALEGEVTTSQSSASKPTIIGTTSLSRVCNVRRDFFDNVIESLGALLDGAITPEIVDIVEDGDPNLDTAFIERILPECPGGDNVAGRTASSASTALAMSSA
jgi:hypothetical protein